MKIFKGFNETGPACPVCNTTDNKPCTLVPIFGTNEGKKKYEMYEATAVHINCIDLVYFDEKKLFVQKIDIEHEE